MPKSAGCKLRQLLINFSAVRILKLCTHATNKANKKTSLTATTVSLLHSSIPGSGCQEARLPIVPPILGQDLIIAEYIPVWGYCRPVRVLIVNAAAALSDSFLAGLAWLAILKAASSLS